MGNRLSYSGIVTHGTRGPRALAEEHECTLLPRRLYNVGEPVLGPSLTALGCSDSASGGTPQSRDGAAGSDAGGSLAAAGGGDTVQAGGGAATSSLGGSGTSSAGAAGSVAASGAGANAGGSTGSGTAGRGVMGTANAPSITFTEYPIPNTSNPGAIATGSDGNLWFNHQSSAPAAIQSVSPAGKFSVVYATEVARTGPIGVAGGPDGNVWFTKQGGIGRVTPSGTVTIYTVPNGGDSGAIANGPDGKLWFTEPLHNKAHRGGADRIPAGRAQRARRYGGCDPARCTAGNHSLSVAPSACQVSARSATRGNATDRWLTSTVHYGDSCPPRPYSSNVPDFFGPCAGSIGSRAICNSTG
jgi:hypothetical protein